MGKRLENKVAIITGGASGIGEEAARLFVEHGIRGVVIADLQEEKGHKVAESIGSERCIFIKCDVADEEQVKSLVESTVKIYGQLDIMFSNAGMTSHPCKQDILDFDMNVCEKLFEVNVRGTIACVKQAGRAMVERGTKGSIICTCSQSASSAAPPALIDYVMSKHAVLGLMRSASKGLGQYGIRVNCVSPGPVATPLACYPFGMSAEEVEEHLEPDFFLKGREPMKTKHIADAVLFLASDDSEFVTGHNLTVDGGFNLVSYGKALLSSNEM